MVNGFNEYPLETFELEYLKAQTGIQDDAALSDHIVKVQADAWEVSTSALRQWD